MNEFLSKKIDRAHRIRAVHRDHKINQDFQGIHDDQGNVVGTRVQVSCSCGWETESTVNGTGPLSMSRLPLVALRASAGHDREALKAVG